MTVRIAAISGAAALAGSAAVAVAAPVSAMPNCQGGNTPWGGGTFCDSQSYSDGSYDH